MLRMPQSPPVRVTRLMLPGRAGFLLEKQRALGHPGLFPLEALVGIAGADRCSVGAAVAAAEERPEPIVQTNLEHLNLAARGESVSRKGPGPNVRSSSLRKSYSSFADQFPAIAHSTPAPTTQPLFRLDALIEAPVFRFAMVA